MFLEILHSQVTIPGLATKGAEVLEQQGIEHAHQVFVYEADVRYSGQALTLPISFEVSELEEHGITVLASRFESLHKQLFTFTLPAAMEIVNCRVKAEEKAEKLGTLPLARGTGEPVAEALKEKTQIYYAGQEVSLFSSQTGTITNVETLRYVQYTDVPIFERSLLCAGDKLVGPWFVSGYLFSSCTMAVLTRHSGDIVSSLSWTLIPSLRLIIPEKLTTLVIYFSVLRRQPQRVALKAVVPSRKVWIQ